MAGDLADAVRTARLKRRALFLRHFVNVAKHLAGARKIEATLWTKLTQGSEDVMRAVDIHVHGGEAVGKTLSHEALCGKVITLVKIVFAEYVKDAGVTLETCWVQRYAVEQMLNAAESCFRYFECDATHQAVHFVA